MTRPGKFPLPLLLLDGDGLSFFGEVSGSLLAELSSKLILLECVECVEFSPLIGFFDEPLSDPDIRSDDLRLFEKYRDIY